MTATLPPNANANLVEIDGPYYAVHLEWLPRVGDQIEFWPLAAGEPPGIRYEVVGVVHDLYGLTDAHPNGHHYPTVHVRRI